MFANRQRRTSTAVLVAVGLAALVPTACSEQLRRTNQIQPAEPGTATVVAVIDGDTVTLRFDTTVGPVEETVRLLGIDAPETVHPNRPEQCHGAEASAALGELLPAGTIVEVRRDVEIRDRYDRLLLYLYRADDGLAINGHLVANGLADTSFYEPNTALVSELTDARRQARTKRRGLWGLCESPDQPVDVDNGERPDG